MHEYPKNLGKTPKAGAPPASKIKPAKHKEPTYPPVVKVTGFFNSK